MSPLRRVTTYDDVKATLAGQMIRNVHYDDPHGGYVLLTVEEYRERIKAAFIDGLLTMADTKRVQSYWNSSSTKVRLDEEVGVGEEAMNWVKRLGEEAGT